METKGTGMMSMAIYVDADAMPRDALATIQRLARRYALKVISVSSINHQIEGANHITVDASPQATDMRIISMLTRGEPSVVVTQDYGLAALALGKGAAALSPTGMQFTEYNMDRLLFERAMHAHERRATGRSKGPKVRSQANRDAFETSLEAVIRKLTSG
jgi:uncharacterized protein YaiI (UPF0178 family)